MVDKKNIFLNFFRIFKKGKRAQSEDSETGFILFCMEKRRGLYFVVLWICPREKVTGDS